MDMVQCRALQAFTEFVPGYGMVHANPASSDENVRNPAFPPSVVARLLEEGRVAPLDGTAPPSLTPPPGELSAPIIGDGSGEVLPLIDSPFTMTHQAFGKYLIEGPGIAPNTLIKGKADAETFIAQAEMAHAEVEAALAASENQKTIEPRELAEGEMLEEGEGGPEGEPIDAPTFEDDAPVD